MAKLLAVSPYTTKHLPRPLALARRLDAARRAFAARAFFAGVEAVGLGGVARRSAPIQAKVCKSAGLIARHY